MWAVLLLCVFCVSLKAPALAREVRSSASSLSLRRGRERRSGARVGGAPAACSSSEDLLEPTATDPAPEAFPEAVYGNFFFQERVKTLAGSKTHPLREGLSFNKEKPGTTKLQKRFVYVSTSETEDEESGEILYEMGLIYKNKKKMVLLNHISMVDIAEDHFVVHSMLGRKRKGDKAGEDTTFKFVFLQKPQNGMDQAKSLAASKAFAESLKELVNDYTQYKSQPAMEQKSVENNQKVDALLAKSGGTPPTTPLDTSGPDAGFLVAWAKAMRGIAMYYITSPKCTASLQIDYQRLGTRTEIDGKACPGQPWCEGAAAADGRGVLFEIFQKYGSGSSGFNAETPASQYLESGAVCAESYPIAVLRAGVQNVAIQLEKRLVYQVFNSVKRKGDLAGKPLAGYARDASVSIKCGSEVLDANTVKLKSVYPTAEDAERRAVRITSKPDGKGATVVVTRILGLQHQSTGTFVMNADYAITVDVAFEASGPVYSGLRVGMKDPEFPAGEHALDEKTQSLLRARVQLLNAALQSS